MQVKADPTPDYLTFTALKANSQVKIGWDSATNVQYSRDGNNWNSLSRGKVITLTNVGDYVQLRAENMKTYPGYNTHIFTPQGRLKVSGSITSLIDGIGADPNVVLPEKCFMHMFDGCENLVHVSELKLPNTTSKWCYQYMFLNCTALKDTPELPATTLAYSCYSNMFEGCTSLVDAPKLTATELAESCYMFMFLNCVSLKNAPELPATTLAEDCYWGMFYGCTSLVTPPVLNATNLVNKCYLYMFENCTGLKIWYDASKTDLQNPWRVPADVSSICSSMFAGCPNENVNFHTGNNLPAQNETYYVQGVIPTNAITVSGDGNGTAFADRTKASQDDTITLYAVPASGYELDKWMINGIEQTANTFTMPAEAVTITAKFKQKPTEYDIALPTSDNGNVKATVSGLEVTKATKDTEVTLTATPDEGYLFDKWVEVSGITITDDKANPLTFTMPADNVSIKATFKSNAPGPKPDPGPDPDPDPDPKPGNDASTSSESARVFVDLDTNKSEVDYGTVFMHNKDNVKMIFDMKVHSVDARTKANQEFLAASYAKNLGKRARIILTTGVYPRNKLNAKDLGTKKFLSYINLEKRVQPVYAVCYNQDDKAYYVTGTINANGTAVFNDFIARDATNITIFTLE